MAPGVRGGSVWSSSPYAPMVQPIEKTEDIGTQGGLTSDVFVSSRVTAPAAGGEQHEFVKKFRIAEVAAVRRERAQELARDADRTAESRRATMAAEASKAAEDSVINTVKLIEKAPTMLLKHIMSLFPKEQKEAKVEVDEIALLRAKLVEEQVNGASQARKMALAASAAARKCKMETKQFVEALKRDKPKSRPKAAEGDMMSAGSMLLRVLVLKGNNLPKLKENRPPTAQVHVSLFGEDPKEGQAATAPVSEDTKPAEPSCYPVWSEKVDFTLQDDGKSSERGEMLSFEVWDTEDSELVGVTYLPLREVVKWRQKDEGSVGEWVCKTKAWLALRSRDNQEIKDGLKESDGPAAILVALSVEKVRRIVADGRKTAGERFVEDYEVPVAEVRPPPTWRDHPGWARVHLKHGHLK